MSFARQEHVAVVGRRKNGLPTTVCVQQPLGCWALNRLEHFAIELVECDFHAPSRTHISFCLWIGKFGIRGVGVTPNESLASYRMQLDATLKSAAENDLVHWLHRCDEVIAEKTGIGLKPPAITNTTKGGLSGQIGMRLPHSIYQQLARAAEQPGLSWNRFVSERLASQAKYFDEAAEMKSEQSLKDDIERVLQATGLGLDNSPQSLKSWSQRVELPLNAKLLALSHEFGYSLARFAAYLLLKSFQTSSGTSLARSQLSAS